MFIENMSCDEVKRKVEKDEEFLKRNRIRLCKEWLKIIKIKRPLPLFFYKSVKTSEKNEYLFCAFSENGRDLYRSKFEAYNTPSGKCYYFFPDNETDSKTGYALTSHFVKRYRERRLQSDCELETALAHFYKECAGWVLLYTDPKNKDKVVYGTNVGLILAEKNTEKKILTFKTYIDDNMLNITQKTAKQKIMSKLNIVEDSDTYIGAIISEYADVVQEIYGSYFGDEKNYLLIRHLNDKNGNKLNYKLSVGKDTDINRFKELTVDDNHFNALSMFSNSKMIGTVFVGDLVEGDENGEGVLVDVEHKQKYVGHLKEGYPHGYGQLNYSDGKSYYVGEWNRGMREGFGKEYHATVNMTYEGMHLHNIEHGKGKITFGDFILEATWNFGDFSGEVVITNKANTVMTKTTWKKEDLHGSAITKCKLGWTDEYKYVRGIRKGKCKRTFISGAICEWDYVNDERLGNTVFYLPDGTTYSMYCNDDDIEGNVKCVDPEGKVTELQFDDYWDVVEYLKCEDE